MPKEKLDRVYYKEAFDRCLCVLKILQEVIITHPTIEQSEQATHLVKGAYSEINAVGKLLLAKAKDNDGIMHDRVYWFFVIINELIICHPVIAMDKDAKKYANQASDMLWKLYQHLDNKTLENVKSKPNPARKRIRK